MARHFAKAACIDWSGEAVARPKGIAVAVTQDDRAPILLRPHGGWSRQAILDWLTSLANSEADLLIGVDFSPALPFMDMGAYFPGWSASPANARLLWAKVDALCSGDRHMSCGSIPKGPETGRHFRQQIGRETITGDQFTKGIGRLRVVEDHCRRGGHGNAASCFNLVGASQVGKSSLTGMRMLHQLDGRVPIWPFDPVPDKGPMIVEIYTSIAARSAGLRGGTKMRDAVRLAEAMTAFELPTPQLVNHDDHSTDALLTAAWLARAASDPALWHPPLLTPEIAQLEGWTFGVP